MILRQLTSVSICFRSSVFSSELFAPTLLSLEEAYNLFLAILGVTDRMVGVENAPTGDAVANNREVTNTNSSSMIMCI